MFLQVFRHSSLKSRSKMYSTSLLIKDKSNYDPSKVPNAELVHDHSLMHSYWNQEQSGTDIKGWSKEDIYNFHKLIVSQMEKRGMKHDSPLKTESHNAYEEGTSCSDTPCVTNSEGDDSQYTPPIAAKKNAQKVLDWRNKYGDEVNGMTAVGWGRARQLASGEKVSLDIVKRMAQFNRHRSNSKIDSKFKDSPWKDAGYVAWLGWGGTEGIEWAIKIARDSRQNDYSQPIRSS